EKVVAMINMDMIGRLRGNLVTAIGGDTADEWRAIVPKACEAARVRCALGGSGYGPSDPTSVYTHGVPVLHFFTGAHRDYPKSSDDAALINGGGGAQIATAVAAVAETVANREGTLSYRKVAPPPPPGDTRSAGASLGTIPDYSEESKEPGVILAGVRPGGPA